MLTKLQTYIQLANQTAANLTRNLENWTGFLTTASRLYKYPFLDRLLIHAQNPQCTAVACFDTWTKKLNYYVHRGAKGIALVHVHNGYPSIRYVFDVSDTGRKKDSCGLYFWQYQEKYRNVVTEALEKHFGIACNDGFPEQLEDIATKLAENYWNDYSHEIMYEINGSLLDGMDELNVGVKFRDVAGNSIAYALLSRCGLHPEKRFQIEDFQNLCDFGTQRLIQILGTVVSQSLGQVLHQIAIAILAYERSKTENYNNSTSHNSKGNTQAKKPTIKEIYELYKPVIKNLILHDEAYQNACKNNDVAARLS